MPFFSIITVCYNAENLIRKTIESVLSQDFTDYEIIVKDAISSDNTLSEIPKDERIHIYSEKDSGIYDGMNQAIDYCSGKYLIFLNCGDFFASNTVLSSIYEVAKRQGDTNTIIYGDSLREGIKTKQPSKISPFYLYRTPLCHQSMFYGKNVFELNGKYNTEYTIVADYDSTLKAFFSGTRFVYCDVTVCKYLPGGISESEKGRALKKKEYKNICNTYFSKKQQRSFEFKLKLSLRNFRQKLASDKSPVFLRKIYRNLVNLVNR